MPTSGTSKKYSNHAGTDNATSFGLILHSARTSRQTFQTFSSMRNVNSIIITGRKKRICIKFVLCKYVANMKFAKLCNQCKGGNRKFAQKQANSAIATFALVAKLCKFHICNIFAQGKFDANSFFRPVHNPERTHD